ncbi:MAG: sel1 repeat family protein [Micavibrio sp.]|nr:MAG: sel1 repeat family protein [Micavibrio sp.]
MFYRFFAVFALCLFLIPAPAAAQDITMEDAYEQGKAAFENEEWGVAIVFLRPIAEAGHDGALLHLGHMYQNGLGVRRHLPTAFDLYRRAAERGNVDAVIATATHYMMGTGTKKDVPTGLNWLVKAAEMDHPVAQFMAGVVYAEGVEDAGVKPDYMASYKWLHLASRHDDVPRRQKRILNDLSQFVARDRLNLRERRRAERLVEAWEPKTWEEVSKDIIPSDSALPIPADEDEEDDSDGETEE